MGTLLVEDGVVALLKADHTLATLLGATTGESHIHPLLMSQREALPVLVYQKISDVPDYVMGGESGLTRSRIQIAVWTAMDPGAQSGYAYACSIANRIRMILSGYHGTVTIGADSIDIDLIALENQVDNYDPETGRGLAMAARISDYMVTYRQDIP